MCCHRNPTLRVQINSRQLMSVGKCCCVLWLIANCGCASSSVGQKPQQNTTEPWTVSSHGAAPYGVSFTIGPFQTSEIGVVQSRAARQEPKPEAETVQFINDKLNLAFELEHISGAKATVRSGFEDTGKFVQVGFLKARKRDTVAGSVSMNGQVVGQFSVRAQRRPDFGMTPEHLAGIEDGSVETSVGTIAVIHRFQPPPPAKSLLAAVMQKADEPVEEYHLGDRIVASRRGLQTTTVSMEPDLPLDVQFCIAAAMAIPLNQQAFTETAASVSMFNASAGRLAR